MNDNLPALSLRQPWAWAIFSAGKTIENRTWGTRYRGRIRIHASKTWDEDGEAMLVHMGLVVPNYFVCRDRGEIGAYIGEVAVTDCWSLDDFDRFHNMERENKNAPWVHGPVCWELADPDPYPEPVPGRGYPGLYWPERF